MKIRNLTDMQWNIWDINVSLLPYAVVSVPGTREENEAKSKMLKTLFDKNKIIEVIEEDDSIAKNAKQTIEQLKEKGVNVIFVEASKTTEVQEPISFKKKVDTVDIVESEDKPLQQIDNGEYIFNVEEKPSVVVTKVKCRGTNRKGKPCERNALAGYEYCLMHMPADVRQRYEKEKLARSGL